MLSLEKVWVKFRKTWVKFRKTWVKFGSSLGKLSVFNPKNVVNLKIVKGGTK